MTPIDGHPILTAAAMRAAEAACGDPALLMERAGAAVATAVARLAGGSPILILCGPGHNGGDGYVAARLLAAAGHDVRVAAIGEPRSPLAIAARRGWTGAVESLGLAKPAPVLVDALFGTGLTRALDDDTAAALHRLAKAARLRIAIDLPSGVAIDDGTVPSEPPRFDVTLALAAPKPAHLLQPAARYCGTVRVLDIGVPVDGDAHVLTTPTLPDPGPDSHKYSRGMVAVVGGDMAGAAELASIAAMRAGAGYVLYLGEGQGPPHALVRRRWSPDALAEPRIGAAVVGPGLGRGDDARARLTAAIASGHPLVIDGDALRLLDPAAPRTAATILTPHAGEFAHLFGHAAGSKIDLTRAAAVRAQAVVVHKGPDTVIAAPDGRVAVSAGASDWLSAAGTGDVLAGAAGAMLAAGLPSFEAAGAAVWLHRAAAERCGRSFMADDLAAALSRVR
jgi:hydroxyethylthiazole kinase-like uncharacterized protein yjeF